MFECVLLLGQSPISFFLLVNWFYSHFSPDIDTILTLYNLHFLVLFFAHYVIYHCRILIAALIAEK